jgi:hypothetical protein
MNQPILCRAGDEVSLARPCNAQRTPLELTCTPMPVTEEQKTRNMKRIMQKAQ